MKFLLTSLFVFSAYFLIDSLWIFYTLEMVARKRVPTASIATVLNLLIAFGVLNYTKNPWYLLPLALGSWLGSYTGLVVKVRLEASA